MGAAFGVCEGSEFAGPVGADGVDAGDLGVPGQLHRGGDDGDVVGGAGPSSPGCVGGFGEADYPAASASLVTVSPAVASRTRLATGAQGIRSAWSSRAPGLSIGDQLTILELACRIRIAGRRVGDLVCSWIRRVMTP